MLVTGKRRSGSSYFCLVLDFVYNCCTFGVRLVSICMKLVLDFAKEIEITDIVFILDCGP